jgi:N-acetyl sugar amidotransferase
MNINKICSKCVLDTSTKLISFDENNVCNFCRQYDVEENILFQKSAKQREEELNKIIDKIKKEQQSNKYDCIVGISGGIDSTYLAHLAVKFGLKPLFVHFNNGWNTELAVQNINNLITKLNIDLYSYVINWEEFKDLQISYFKASVIDIEIPTDQLIFAVLFKLAKKYKIKYILEGYNFRTEFGLPMDWTFEHKFDIVNLKNIHKKFGTKKLNNFPTLSKSDFIIYNEIYKVNTIDLLNKIDYKYNEVIELLKKEYNYVPYLRKHYESIFTRFYQGYILPKKFNVDKRKAHLSTKIRSDIITREEALYQLSIPPYPVEQQELDKAYVLKKWEMTEAEFNSIMNQNPIDHLTYGIEGEPSWFTKFRVRLFYIYLFKFAYPLGLKKKDF